MIKFVVALALSLPAFALAEPALKSLRCSNTEIKVDIDVYTDYVEWTVSGLDLEDKIAGPFSGYIFADGKTLDAFSSTDMDSDIEVNSLEATLSYGDVTDVRLSCKQR